MLSLGNKTQYHMCCTPIDIRKGFDGLSGLVLNYLKKDPLTGDVFVFLNKNKTHIKMLCWDGDGFMIFFKRLERGTFDLLKNDTPSRELKREELLMVLEGIRMENCKKKKRFLSTKNND
jgi:transposase